MAESDCGDLGNLLTLRVRRHASGQNTWEVKDDEMGLYASGATIRDAISVYVGRLHDLYEATKDLKAVGVPLEWRRIRAAIDLET